MLYSYATIYFKKLKHITNNCYFTPELSVIIVTATIWAMMSHNATTEIIEIIKLQDDNEGRL